MAVFAKLAVRTLKRVSQPEAINVGLNLGKASGGSVGDHLHLHVVPRWAGDSNFMTVIGGTKVLPQLLKDTRALLAVAQWIREQDDALAVARPIERDEVASTGGAEREAHDDERLTLSVDPSQSCSAVSDGLGVRQHADRSDLGAVDQLDHVGQAAGHPRAHVVQH